MKMETEIKAPIAGRCANPSMSPKVIASRRPGSLIEIGRCATKAVVGFGRQVSLIVLPAIPFCSTGTQYVRFFRSNFRGFHCLVLLGN